MNKEKKKAYFKKNYEDHKDERRAKQRIYYQEHREEIIKKNCQYQRSRKSWKREGDIRRRYGISSEEYNDMFQEQKGKCAICKSLPNGKGNTLHVDHDHNTGKVRRLLCHNCNVAIGHAKHDTSILQKMIDYLLMYK